MNQGKKKILSGGFTKDDNFGNMSRGQNVFRMASLLFLSSSTCSTDYNVIVIIDMYKDEIKGQTDGSVNKDACC